MKEKKEKLARLNLDVLICIASHLDITSISRLSQTSRFFLDFVESHGWKAHCMGRGISSHRDETISTRNSTAIIRSISSSSASSAFSPSASFKLILQADKAWGTKTFRSYQTRLPFATNPNGKVERQRPQPLLLFAPLGLFLFTGSEMRLWHKDLLQNLKPLQMKQAQVFYLTNPAGLDKQTSNNGSSALWDICACTRLDHDGRHIAIGRLNGLVEIVKISKSKNHSRQRGKMIVNLVWIWRDITCSTSIQSMHASSSSGLLAIAGKNGNVALFRLALKESNVQANLVEHWSVGSRPWSVWVEGSSWLAVGTNGSEPIILFPLEEQTCKTGYPIRLSTGRTKWTSVYAMQSRLIEGKCHLLAGCYDGTLRDYNVDLVLSRHYSAKSPPSELLLPSSQYRDRFDPSAIYCLSAGVGQGGQDIAAGTARHGVCKFFRITAPLREEESWSMFAAHPCESPTYSIVGQYNRLFGVTDAIFWQLDTRTAAVFSPPSDGRSDQKTMAFYRHGDMIIDRTSWPSF